VANVFNLTAWLAEAEQTGYLAGRVALGFADTAQPDGTSAPGNYRLRKLSGQSAKDTLRGLHLLRKAGLVEKIGDAVPGELGTLFRLNRATTTDRNAGSNANDQHSPAA